MSRLFFLVTGFVLLLSCSKKESVKPICEEEVSVEEVKIEPRHHSRW